MSNLAVYFKENYASFFRQPSGLLEHPFIVPGAVYQNQLWDWDSYWCSVGLFRLAKIYKDDSLRRQIADHSIGCLLNFFSVQSDSGALPIMMSDTNPDFFGCLNDEGLEMNQAKPVFGQFALLISEEIGDVQWFSSLFDQLLKYYGHWRKKYASRIGLLVWGSDVAIGVDNDPTTYGRPFFSSANLLLNCLYYADLQASAKLAEKLGRSSDVRELNHQADRIADAMRQYCWDDRDRFFYTVDVQCEDYRAELLADFKPGMPLSWSCLPLRIQMFTGFLPMWCGVATKEQADVLVEHHYKNPNTFLASYGVRTLSAAESMYSMAASGNPSNWLGPIWILTNYFLWKGLRKYHFIEEADELAAKTKKLLEQDLSVHRQLHEYYQPESGEPLMNPGFMSWNLLVLEMINE